MHENFRLQLSSQMHELNNYTSSRSNRHGLYFLNVEKTLDCDFVHRGSYRILLSTNFHLDVRSIIQFYNDLMILHLFVLAPT